MRLIIDGNHQLMLILSQLLISHTLHELIVNQVCRLGLNEVISNSDKYPFKLFPI